MAEGNSDLEGRVEICANNIWSLVCHDGWNLQDARVVCRQLGYFIAGKQGVGGVGGLGFGGLGGWSSGGWSSGG